MKQGINKDSQFVRHGMLGCYASDQDAAAHPMDEDTLRGNLKTSFPVFSEGAAQFSLATTGSICALPSGGTVAISGKPYFRDSRMSEIAEKNSYGAAVAFGYATHSDRVFEHIHGAFCCAIIDTSFNRVLVGIDRLGQHSLYYRAAEGSLTFGNTASETLACSKGSATLLNQGIYNYLYFHMIPSPDTVYDGLKKLPSAHYLDYQDNHCRLVNYWQPSFSESTEQQSFESLSGELRGILRKAVERCSADAGKPGSFLSGGLDSSTVTGVLAEVSEGNAQAYSIGFSAQGYDEMAYARITANHFDVELNEYYVTPQDVVDALPMIATSYDEPFGNSSALPAYFCAKMAAENGVDTLLAGDGGDEIFAGNERYVLQNVFEQYHRLPQPIRRGLLEPLVKAIPRGLPLAVKAKSYINQANTPLPDRLQNYNFLHRHLSSEIFSEGFLEDIDRQAPLALQRSIYHRPEAASDLNRMLYLDWQITLADNDLRKVNHMCALAGVNVTYPMLDDALVEFSCQIPGAWKIKGNDLRYFFKRALQSWLPQETINKNKQGFGLPFGVWMQNYQPLRELAYDNLLKLKDRGLIQPAFIDKTIEMHQSKHAAYYGELVWIFTVFELWMEAQQE